MLVGREHVRMFAMGVDGRAAEQGVSMGYVGHVRVCLPGKQGRPSGRKGNGGVGTVHLVVAGPGGGPRILLGVSERGVLGSVHQVVQGLLPSRDVTVSPHAGRDLVAVGSPGCRILQDLQLIQRSRVRPARGRAAGQGGHERVRWNCARHPWPCLLTSASLQTGIMRVTRVPSDGGRTEASQTVKIIQGGEGLTGSLLGTVV